MVIVVMGVSGSGKTTVGQLLADALGAEFAEGDAYHPPANIEKMRRGIPLEDADRWPWLQTLAAQIDRWLAAGTPVVLACSALKQRYRDILAKGRPGVRFVYLEGDKALIRASPRCAAAGHYMPASLAGQPVRRPRAAIRRDHRRRRRRARSDRGDDHQKAPPD